MSDEIYYEYLDHFAYYPFVNDFLIIACNSEDEPIGYVAIGKNNEICKLYVYPDYRGGPLLHVLLKEALMVAKSFGMTFLWGFCYDRMHKFYSRTYAKTAEMHGYSFKFVESPDERDDDHWVMVGELLGEDNNRSA